MPLQRSWLKKSVLIPVALAATISTLFLLVLLLTVLSQAARQEFARDLLGTRDHWREDLEHRSDTLRALGQWLKDNRPLRSATARGDRGALSKLAVPLYATLQRDYQVSSLSLLRPDGTPLLRLGHADGDNAPLVSPGLERARRSGLMESDIELNSGNQLQLRAAIPWHDNGRLIGYLMLGQNAGAVLDEVDRLFGMEHLVALDPARLPTATTPANTKAPLVLTDSSLSSLPERLRQLLRLDRINELADGLILERAGYWFHVGLIPLETREGQRLGWIVALRDVSGVRTTLLLSAAAVGVVTLVILTLLLVFLFRVTSAAEQSAATVYDELQNSFDRLEQAHTEWIESFDAIGQPIFIHDEQFRVVRANRRYAEQAGMPLPEVLGKPYWEVFPKDGGPLPGCADAMAQGRIQHEEEVRLPNGQVYMSRAFPIRDAEGEYRYSIHVMQDVTELERLGSALGHEIRARRTISASNHALIHTSDEKELLRQACTIATTLGGYHIAWVGFKRHDHAHTLERVAISGVGENDPEVPQLSWSEEAAGRNASSYVARNGETLVVPDMKEDRRFPGSAELAGRFGFSSAAVLPLRAGEEIIGVLYIAARQTNAFTDEEIELLGELADDLAYGIATLRERRARETAEQAHVGTLEKLKNTLSKTVQAIALAVEARDPYTAGHQQRVSELVGVIATTMGWDEERIEAVRVAAIIHDVGNIYVPAEILSKPGKLSPLEFELVKTHAEVGHRILSAIDFPWPIAEMVLQHHERLDGSGYPQGLKGDAIMAEAQLIAVAELVEAMSSHRPYRAAVGVEQALQELERQRGKKYAPEIVDACLRLFREQGYRIAPLPPLG